MILQSLVQYYEELAQQNAIPLPGWCHEKVSFALNISFNGELLDVIPTTDEKTQGKKTKEVPQIMQVPERVVRAGITPKANFLCDNASYLLGFDKKDNPQRAVAYFSTCKLLHQDILQQVQDPAAKAILHFFETWNPAGASTHPQIAPYLESLSAANLIFQIDGGPYAQTIPALRSAWEHYTHLASDAPLLPCLVTGKTLPVAQLHGKIKGIPGAQSAGANLISYNDRSSESYGGHKKQSANAFVSEYAAFAYVTALNHLIADTAHRQLIGNATVVYWAEQAKPEPRDFFAKLMNPQPSSQAMLQGMIAHIAQGKYPASINPQDRFFLLALSPNAARISVRFFLQESFGQLLNNLIRHYERLCIVRPVFDPVEYLSIPALLAETVNPHSKDKTASPLLAGEVLRAVLTGAPYPQALYQAVMIRIRAGRDDKDKHIYKITRGRAAIIKAVLLRQGSPKDKEVLTVALNEQSSNKPYVLGRLFSVLENVQKTANPDINTTIKERFFNSACATPNIVFPTVLKLHETHLKKISSDRKGLAVSLEKQVQDLLGRIELEDNAAPFPAHLSLNDQGIFILGYYHQTQARYEKKED